MLSIAMDITSNAYLNMVSGKANRSDVTGLDKQMGVRRAEPPPRIIVSTVMNNQWYKDDSAALSLTNSDPEFIVGTPTTATWTGNVSFSELKDG